MCSVLPICKTHTYSMYVHVLVAAIPLTYTWRTIEEYKGMHTNMATLTHVYTSPWNLSFFPIFGDGAECSQGKVVYVSICSVLSCVVLNMTHVKRLWVALSLFERDCRVLSLNYWENVTHLCLGECRGPIIDLIIYSVDSQYVSIMSNMTWNNMWLFMYN